jgi:GT2 family glycosyltransferase
MKTILILCVNYNSYHELNSYLKSIDEAAQCVNDCVVKVLVADTTTDNIQLISTAFNYISVEVAVCHENLGYIGGIRRLITSYAPISCDYTIVSNVDVILPSDFFVRLLAFPLTEEVGWIAPAIYSESESKDRNPKLVSRPSKRHLQLAKQLYIHPWIYNLYVTFVYNKRKSENSVANSSQTIYGGHGSFMIFTDFQVVAEAVSQYKAFLFCEENLFAEELQLRHKTVQYIPEISVNDLDHASTSKLRGTTYCRWNRAALSFILNRYY